MVEMLDNIATALSDQLKVLMWLDAIGRVNPGNLWPPCFFVSKLLLERCLGVVSARHPWKLLLLGVETVEHLHFSFAVPPGHPKMRKENNFENYHLAVDILDAGSASNTPLNIFNVTFPEVPKIFEDKYD